MTNFPTLKCIPINVYCMHGIFQVKYICCGKVYEDWFYKHSANNNFTSQMYSIDKLLDGFKYFNFAAHKK